MPSKYLWKKEKRYNDFSTYFKHIFNQRVQKISINAGFTCPNRDGTKGRGGCIYCNNKTFNPYYCRPEKSITQQLNEGIAFFSPKYNTQKYLAYFQAFTNTYAPFDLLKESYEEALKSEKVVGLVIATRPDCIDNQLLDYLEVLSEKYYIVLEFGIESCYDRTLNLINRQHTFKEAVKALENASGRGIHLGAHFIFGLPQESLDDMLAQADIISGLPIETLKLHQLQIIKGTEIEKMFYEKKQDFVYFSPDKYVEFIVTFLERLNPKIIVERFISESPKELIISPNWQGLKNFQLMSKIEKQLEKSDTWQGAMFITPNP